MSPNAPSPAPPVQPAPAPAPLLAPASAPPKKGRCLLYGCGALLVVLLLIVLTVVITLWWIQRPIKPVVLTTTEKAEVEEKLNRISDSSPARHDSPRPAQPPPPSKAAPADSHPYVPGGKTLRLTEREINGLLNANTDLGNAVHLEFARDAVNAYVAVPIPKDFPVGGGRMFRARGRFALSLGSEGAPYAVLEDVTVFGLSLPKAWLGGLKGENLLNEAAGTRHGRPVLKGIKSLRLEPGALVLEVEN